MSAEQRLADLIEEIELADQVGLDVFGIGEHHRKEFLDSAPTVILAAAAARTKRIHLTSAVTVLSAADPVRVFQEFATLDLISRGRAEMIVGRGSFVEAFPLFGLKLDDYDSLFTEKLDLLLKINQASKVHWSGKHRAALTGQGIYPRPAQPSLPIWLGVGGTPESFMRAGTLGLPLMVAIIGGEPHRFLPLINLYREAGIRAGHAPEKLRVGLHCLGYVADTTAQAAEEFFRAMRKPSLKSDASAAGRPPRERNSMCCAVRPAHCMSAMPRKSRQKSSGKTKCWAALTDSVSRCPSRHCPTGSSCMRSKLSAPASHRSSGRNSAFRQSRRKFIFAPEINSAPHPATPSPVGDGRTRFLDTLVPGQVFRKKIE